MEITYTPQTNQTPAHSVPSAELDRERRRRLAAEQERDQANTRIQRLELERSAFFQVLGNQALLPAERITSLFTLFEIEHNRGAGHALGPYIPICVKAVAGRAGLSSDTMSKAVGRLAQFGAWEKSPREECRPVQSETTGNWTTPVVLATTGETLMDNLHVLAQLAPTSNERLALTGKSRHGSRPGEKRQKIDRACPDCGSTNTRLQCLDCGAVTHTDELIAQSDEGQSTEPQLTGPSAGAEKQGAEEQSAAHNENTDKGQTTEPHVAATPSSPDFATDLHVAVRDENTEGRGATEPHVAAQYLTYIDPHVTATPPEAVPVAPTCKLQVPPSEAPAWLPPQLGNIPQELLNRPQWVAWRAVERDGKWTKPPMDSRTGDAASVTDPATWGTIYEAMGARRRYGADGIGFMLTADDPYVGIDLDVLDDQARTIITTLDSYTEWSPSGRGVHVLVRATKPPGRCKHGPVEMYDRGRFLTITGRLVPDSLAVIRDRQHELNAVHVRLFPLPAISLPAVPSPRCIDDDGELVARMLNAKNGPSSCALWRGDWSGHPSHSEGVWHLLLRLAYWTGGDTSRMDRLLRQSGLYDPEDWERPDGAYGTHGQRDVQRARDAWVGSSTVGRHDA